MQDGITTLDRLYNDTMEALEDCNSVDDILSNVGAAIEHYFNGQIDGTEPEECGCAECDCDDCDCLEEDDDDLVDTKELLR